MQIALGMLQAARDQKERNPVTEARRQQADRIARLRDPADTRASQLENEVL